MVPARLSLISYSVVPWLVAVLVTSTAGISCIEAEEPSSGRPTAAERQELREVAVLSQQGVLLYQWGEDREVSVRLKRCIAILQRMYPDPQYYHDHPDLAIALNNVGSLLLVTGEHIKALPYYAKALTIRQRLYPELKYPDGHSEIAESLQNVGTVLHAMSVNTKALSYYERALAMWEKLYPGPDGRHEIAQSLHNMGMLLQAMADNTSALSYYERALAMWEKLYPGPDGHPDYAQSLHNMGQLLLAMREYRMALARFERGLAMQERLYPKTTTAGHPALASSLQNIGLALTAMGEYGKALPRLERALAMWEKLWPKERFQNGHPYLAWNLSSLGLTFAAMGDHDKALPYYERALAIWEKLYPDGHPNFAAGLDNLGALLEVMGEHKRAVHYFGRALAMREKLYPKWRYPNGRPEIAQSLHNVSLPLEMMDEHIKAVTYLERAVAMWEKLYSGPDGDARLASSLNNLGLLLLVMDQPDRALVQLERSLVMNQKLYTEAAFPDGHPDLAASLYCLSKPLAVMGENDKALAYLQRALIMYRRLAEREMASAAEAQVLARVQSLPRASDHYFSTVLHLPQTAAAAYQHVWWDKAVLMRLQQRRHEATLIARSRSKEVQTKHERLIEVRQQINRQFVDPGKDLKARDRRLAELTDEQEKLERELAALLPQIPRQKEFAKLSPDDLAARMPPDAVFIDFRRFTELEKYKVTGHRYLAFVVAPQQPVKRIDLGHSRPIDEAITSWRHSIDQREPSLAPQELRRLVWDKIAQILPANTRTVYLCPDSDLGRLPFAALPGKRAGTVLLEDYVLALTPHGPWLLEKLIYPPKFPDSPARLVAVGGVCYDPPRFHIGKPYDDLRATLPELRQVQGPFPGKTLPPLTGQDATVAMVKEWLPQARYAHLATHGYFDEKALAEDRKRIQEGWKSWEFRPGGTWRTGLGVRNPLGYVGLVLAGANDPKQAGSDGGILSGLGIVDLPLEGLRLCVLSACETGLGDLTEGEGVIGLQRAFHVAGCPNVIGSLWKVNDVATAALMAQFYHELWVNKRPPLEALREAQLVIYRHPERIPELAGDRGRPVQEKAAKLGSAMSAPGNPAENPRRADTKLWAAFVLSGTGR